MSAREEILERIRRALSLDPGLAAGGPPLPEGPTPGGSTPGGSKTGGSETGGSETGAIRAQLVREFGRQLVASGGVLHAAVDERAAGELLRELIRERRLERIACSDAPELAALIAGSPEVHWIHSRADGHEPEERRQLFAVCAGLSGAQLAVAETGTLALDSRAERHRLASLVPPIHIVLLHAEAIVADLGQALEHFRGALPPALSFVTGPSRTADIELELVIGVHGPRELHVLLIDARDSPA